MKNLFLSTVGRLGGYAFCRGWTRNSFRVLAYHGVGPTVDPVVDFDGLQVTPDVFRQQLDVLKKKYHVVSLADVVLAVRGKKELPPCSVAITFDDGYRNNLTVAAPLLLEYGFPATFFITTGYMDGSCQPWWYRLRQAVAQASVSQLEGLHGETVDLGKVENKVAVLPEWEKFLVELPSKERDHTLNALLERLGSTSAALPYPMMNWEEVSKLVELGFDIGAHTHSHISLQHEGVEQITHELNVSLDRLHEKLGSMVTSFAYPNNRMPKDVTPVSTHLMNQGILSAVTGINHLNKAGSDPYKIGRWHVVAGHTGTRFEALMSGFLMLVKRLIS